MELSVGFLAVLLLSHTSLGAPVTSYDQEQETPLKKEAMATMDPMSTGNRTTESPGGHISAGYQGYQVTSDQNTEVGSNFSSIYFYIGLLSFSFVYLKATPPPPADMIFNQATTSHPNREGAKK